jgi:hypothetical protein
MFDKAALDTLLDELKSKYGNEADWELLLRDAHLGIARSDAGVDLGAIDSRAADLIKAHAG